MVPWVFSIPGERRLEGNIPSLEEEHFSLCRGLTNLEKSFHTEAEEDTVQTPSGWVQTQNNTLCLFFWPSWTPLRDHGGLGSTISRKAEPHPSFWGNENILRGKLSCRKHSKDEFQSIFIMLATKLKRFLPSSGSAWPISSAEEHHHHLGYNSLSKERVSKSFKSLKTLCCCSSL